MASLQYKVLGQAAPSASSQASLYSAPSATGDYAIISTLVVCNTSNLVDEIRVAVIQNGGSLGSSSYIIYNTGINGYSAQTYTLGITLAAGDAISIWSTYGYTSFNLFGTENS